MKGRLIVSALFVAGVGLAVACSVDVDISKKACPCGPGYVCDTAQNLCVVTLSSAQPQPTTAPTTAPACDPCKCETSVDCKDKSRPFCEPASKQCVECDPAKADSCAEDRFCNAQFQCAPGCRTDAVCAKLSPGTTCALDRHQCVQCKDDTGCAAGTEKCANGTCVKKCSGGTGCAGGATCCGELCIDTTSDRFNCGACDLKCTATNGTPSCAASKCSADCADGFKTCGTGAAANCATNVRTDLKNCGDCGKQCNLANVQGARCAVGQCAFDSCNPWWLDADGNPANGCEMPCGQEAGQTCCPGGQCDQGRNCKTNGPQAGRNKCE